MILLYTTPASLARPTSEVIIAFVRFVLVSLACLSVIALLQANCLLNTELLALPLGLLIKTLFPLPLGRVLATASFSLFGGPFERGCATANFSHDDPKVLKRSVRMMFR